MSASTQRKSKNNNDNQLILSGAKKNFLAATDTLKTPTKSQKSDLIGDQESPKSLIKGSAITSLGTPPKKPKNHKFWKTRWQEKVNGVVPEKGKKKRTNEADKLLDDEGVIQMLNKVPSVFGEVPRASGNSSSRTQRLRTTANKPGTLPAKITARSGSTESRKRKLDAKSAMPKTSDESNIATKRARNCVPNQFLTADVVGALNSDDSFSLLNDLPSDQMELLMNCDIRYSLPKQGAPASVLIKPSKSKNENSSSGSREPGKSSPGGSDLALVKVKPIHQPITSKQQPFCKLPSLPSSQSKSHVANKLQDLLHQFKDGGENADNELTTPGQYNHIHLRLYDSFAQILLSSSSTKLTGSLNPCVIDEITQALSYVTNARHLKGVLISGIGNIFCQGVDLHYLCHDSPERRRTNAALMASAVERLVLAMSTFPKLLVAAVNGSARGLGVTWLPLFDIVYANDKAMFSTFFSRLGQIPEGGASVTIPQFSSGLGGALHEMLLLGRQLTADQMEAAGLVTAVFMPGKLLEEVIPRLKRACSQTNPGIQMNKLLLKQHQSHQVEQVLSSETQLLTEIWSSKQYHVNLVNFISSEKCLQFQKPS